MRDVVDVQVPVGSFAVPVDESGSVTLPACGGDVQCRITLFTVRYHLQACLRSSTVPYLH